MTKQERLNKTLEILDVRHFASTADLAGQFEVSEMTVRRDLSELAAAGKVRMVYGGVASLGKDAPANGYLADAELDRNADQKRRIAARASELIAPGDVVFLDSGTTVQLLAECLPAAESYTFICYSLNTVSVVAKRPNSTLIVPGGLFSPKSLVFSGQDAVATMRRYRANKAFMGATGYEMKHGLTCAFVEDCAMKQAAMESSVERILLIDSSKFGKVSTCSFAGMERFEKVVTDSGIPQPYAADLKSKGSELLIV